MIKDCGISKSKVYDARNKYFSSNGYPTKTMRQKYISYCSKLITEMTIKNATAEELERALLFSLVVLDSIKCRLSLIKAKDDLDILELEMKYVRSQ
jgi:hypothetical protein